MRGEVGMKFFASLSLAIATLIGASNLGIAQVLKQEPSGTVPTGKKVLVDDGTCGPGKIKEVTGGSNQPGNPINRSSRCIPKR